jgi:hypothetical protein
MYVFRITLAWYLNLYHLSWQFIYFSLLGYQESCLMTVSSKFLYGLFNVFDSRCSTILHGFGQIYVSFIQTVWHDIKWKYMYANSITEMSFAGRHNNIGYLGEKSFCVCIFIALFKALNIQARVWRLYPFLECFTFILQQWLWQAVICNISCCDENRTRISLLHSWAKKFAHFAGNCSHVSCWQFVFPSYSDTILDGGVDYPLKLYTTLENSFSKCQQDLQVSLSSLVFQKKQPELGHW